MSGEGVVNMAQDEPRGLWKRAPWDWAYRFVLPDDHEHAGQSVFGCGFTSRDRAGEAMAAAKRRYLGAGPRLCATCRGPIPPGKQATARYCGPRCRRRGRTLKAHAPIPMRPADPTEPSRLIPLRDAHGVVVAHAIVDAGDYEHLAVHDWHLASIGYARRTLGVSMHRIIAGLVPGDGLTVDHINRDKLDNRRINLRVGTQGENQQNVSPQRNVTSRYRGVCWHKERGVWRAYVTVRGRQTQLGVFDDEHEAGRAAAEARQRLMAFAVEDPPSRLDVQLVAAAARTR